MVDKVNYLCDFNNKKNVQSGGGLTYLYTDPTNVYLSRIYTPSFMPTFLVEPFLTLGNTRGAARRLKNAYRSNYFNAVALINEVNATLNIGPNFNSDFNGKTVKVDNGSGDYTIRASLGGNYFTLRNASGADEIYNLASMIFTENSGIYGSLSADAIREVNRKLNNVRLNVGALNKLEPGKITITMDSNVRTADAGEVASKVGGIAAESHPYYTVKINGKDHARYHILSIKNNLLN